MSNATRRRLQYTWKPIAVQQYITLIYHEHCRSCSELPKLPCHSKLIRVLCIIFSFSCGFPTKSWGDAACGKKQTFPSLHQAKGTKHHQKFPPKYLFRMHRDFCVRVTLLMYCMVRWLVRPAHSLSFFNFTYQLSLALSPPFPPTLSPSFYPSLTHLRVF